MAKYLDQTGLKIFIAKITETYNGRYLGLHAAADEANKVTNAFTVNVGGEAVVFDGSVAKSAEVAAAKHTHLAKDITDFKTEVRKEVFGEGAKDDGFVEIHSHKNRAELDKIADGDVANWRAKIGTADVDKLVYSNDYMSGVDDVKAALDVLAANVVRTAGLLDLNGKAMQDVEKKADDNAAAITEMKNEAVANSLANRIKALENANAEGGAVTKAIGAVEDKADAAQQQADKGVADAKAAQDDVDALEELVGDIEEGKTVAELIGANAQAAAAAQSAADKAQGEVDALEGVVDQFKTDQATKDGKQDAAIAAKVAQDDYDVKIKALEDEDTRLDQAIKDEAARADAAEKANKAVLDKLDGADTVEGSVKKQIKDAIAEVNGAAATLEGRVAANEGKLAVIQGADTVAGSIAKAEKDAKAYADAQDVVALQAAKDYADGKITALVNSAPEAMDTLNELANAINDNKDIYDAYVEEHATAMATMKSDLQKEIDTDVKAEADRAKGVEQGLQAAIDKLNGANTETGSVAKAVKDAVDAQALIDEAQNEQINAKVAQSAYNTKVAEIEKAIDDLEALHAENGAVDQKVAVAAQAAAAAQADVDALEKYVKGNDLDGKGGIEGRLADVEAHFAEGENSVDAKIAAAQTAAKAEAARLDGLLKKELQDEIDTDVQAANDALSVRVAVFEPNGSQDVAAKEVRLAAAEADIDELEAFVAAQPAIDTEQNRRLGLLEADNTKNKADITDHETRIAANTAALLAIGEPMNEDDIETAIKEVFTNL